MNELPPELRAGLAGRYDLEVIIGRGGMATVYRARDCKHDRQVAVKVLRPDLAASIGTERFLKEIEIAARLSHPHILPLHDSGEANGFLYYVMPFVDGESLRGVLNRIRLMDVSSAREIVRRVADALDYAHRQHVVHRDIKPENVLLPDGHAVVADFGIAKAVSSAADGALTRTGIALGTPGYMSPEQAAGATDLDARTDVYSLAVVAYEMLVGGLPGVWVSPEGQQAGRFVDASRDHRRHLDRLPAGLERALMRALAVRRDDRFPTPGEFASAMEHPEELTRHGAPAVRPPADPGEPAPFESASPATAARTDAMAASGSAFLGGPTVLVMERVVAGEVPADELPALVEEIRATFGVEGYHSATERSLLWTGRKPERPVNWTDWEELVAGMGDTEGPPVMVRVSSRRGRTRIRVEQRLGRAAGGIFGGIVGGGGMGLGGGVVAATWALLGDPFAGLILGSMTGVGSYAIAHAIYRAVVASKKVGLESLVERLADHCEEVAG